MVLEQGRLIEEQKRVIEEQSRRIEELEGKVEEASQLALSAHNRLQELAEKPAAASADEALRARLAELEKTVERVPELAEKKIDVEFPNSFAVPGTDARLRIGGMVRLVYTDTFDALGSDDRFIVSSIPIEGTPEAGKTSRISFSAGASRANLDFRMPTNVGVMRLFLESDFAASGNQARLRHAYGQWAQWLLGQTWSTFSDPEAEPDGLDFEGLNAISLLRQTQVRWTRHFSDTVSMAVAIEDPKPDLTGAAGVSQVPDLVVRARWDPESKRTRFSLFGQGSHVQAAVVGRHLRGEIDERPDDTLATLGWGVNLSGAVPAPWWSGNDRVSFAWNFGEGIGRYIADLGSLGGQDAIYDPERDELVVLPVGSGYVGYQHWWSERTRSTVTVGFVWVDNLEIQSDDALHRTERFSLNLAWSPIAQLDLIAEYLWGTRYNKDGRRGSAHQLQLGGLFRF
ncbi:MAG TPA: DcaP family trimeric outer membrane transporter [Thermoanaerobaculia bacterium]|nr:DcaP family trimeric outer membrane transporter [Thermoanaerobaculia bacterium]